MAKAKKPSGAKAITDVAHPGTSAPSDTTKSIITPRPIIKDPMMLGSDAKEVPKEEPEKPSLKKIRETKIDPLGKQSDTPVVEETETPEPTPANSEEESKSAADADNKAEADAEPDIKADDTKNDDKTDTDDRRDTKEKTDDKAQDEAEAEEVRAEKEARIQKLIDSKKYSLPINAVEHRRSARFVAVGVLLALILAAAWVDVALDAGLIHLGSIKPVTHLFSN